MLAQARASAAHEIPVDSCSKVGYSMQHLSVPCVYLPEGQKWIDLLVLQMVRRIN